MNGLVLFALAIATASPIASLAPPSDDADRALAESEVIREISYDICLPATAEEYAALGKNAVVMLTSSSADATELPLRSVYVMNRGARIPLQRLALFGQQTDPGSGRSTQVPFYLLPIRFMKRDSQLLADFSGERTGFGIARFSAAQGLDPDAPAFARLDEHDAPGPADPAAVARLLPREYPDFFR